MSQSWELVERAAPKLAKTFKELPNSVRKMLGQPTKFFRRVKSGHVTGIVPTELQEAVVNCVVPCQLNPFHLYISLIIV